MTLIAHLSDLHFGKEILKRKGALKTLLEKTSPDLIVITGDLTQRATLRQYQASQEFLQDLPTDYLAVPGNHDLSIHRLYERFQNPWKKWELFINKETEPVFQTENVLLMGLNTVSTKGYKLNWARGRIKEEQIQQVTNRMDTNAASAINVLALHHPLWLPEKYRHRKRVGNSIIALKAFRRGGLDLILSGHIHHGFVKLKSGIILCNAGSAFSRRLKSGQKNEFNLISLKKTDIQIKKVAWTTDDYQLTGKWQFKKTDGNWYPVSE